MFDTTTFLAIIPARGGSKRLPKKNLLELNGKPLIAYTIEAGLKSKYIDTVVVSSDNDKILEVSTYYGADTLKRPASLATDIANTNEMISHVLEKVQGFDFIVLLQPTSPLRNSVHIDEAIEYLLKKEADAIISVCEVEHSPLWSNVLPKDKSMSGFLKEDDEDKRSQDLETYYRLNGAIYICRVDRFLIEKKLFLKDNIFAYRMSKKYSVDIDDIFDFKLAEIFLATKSTYQIKDTI